MGGVVGVRAGLPAQGIKRSTEVLCMESAANKSEDHSRKRSMSWRGPLLGTSEAGAGPAAGASWLYIVLSTTRAPVPGARHLARRRLLKIGYTGNNSTQHSRRNQKEGPGRISVRPSNGCIWEIVALSCTRYSTAHVSNVYVLKASLRYTWHLPGTYFKRRIISLSVGGFAGVFLS